MNPEKNTESLDRNRSTMLVRGGASQQEHDEVMQVMQEKGAVLEHCPKCNSLLDVSGCEPLTETICPSCGALIKVLREFEHFVLLSHLGQGGAGAVYRAFDETLERDVALKLLRNEHTSNPEFVAGLEREAQIMASISHPHVVKVYSTGRKNGYYYIAMEIVNGGTLAQRIKRDGPLPEAAVLSLGVQLADGLRAAWKRGLMHRDVKPGNILFVERQAIKVADFGLAMPLEQLGEESGDIWGTPEYIAPEKLLREGEDLRSDIYSLGCTLFHCLAGKPPLPVSSVKRVIMEGVAQTAPALQSFAPQVSGAAAFVIDRCLQPTRLARYQSYDELIEHLQYAIDQAGKSLKSPDAPPSKAAPRDATQRAKKGPPKIALAGLIALLAVVGGFFALRPTAPAPTASAKTNTAPPITKKLGSEAASPKIPPPYRGRLTAKGDSAQTEMNLTAEGSIDWVHFGDTPHSPNVTIRKNGSPHIVSDFLNIGAGELITYVDDLRPIIWLDGPLAHAFTNRNGVFTKEIGHGFAIEAPADPTTKTLTVHVGGWRCSGAFSAHLSDDAEGTQDYADSTVIAPNQFARNYTVTYQAGSPGQTLTVKWVMDSNHGDSNITIASAALNSP